MGRQYCALNINIHNLPDEFSLLVNILSRLKDVDIVVHFILPCQTFLKDANALLYQIPVYYYIHKSRNRLTESGVAMYITNDVPCNIRDDLSLLYEAEFESAFA